MILGESLSKKMNYSWSSFGVCFLNIFNDGPQKNLRPFYLLNLRVFFIQHSTKSTLVKSVINKALALMKVK
jgi:hypothetical protein